MKRNPSYVIILRRHDSLRGGSVDTKSVTIQDLTDAIERNGVKHVRGHLWDSFTEVNKEGYPITVIRGGCAMAQGLLNLGVSEDFFSILQAQIGSKVSNYALEHPEVFGDDRMHSEVIGERIVYLNDHRGLTLGEIAARLRTEYEPLLSEVIENVPTHEYHVDPNSITTPEQAEKELVLATV